MFMIRNKMHLPPGTKELRPRGIDGPIGEVNMSNQHQPPCSQPSPHITTQQSAHGFLVTAPEGQITVPLIHTSDRLLEPTLPSNSTQRPTTTKMKTTGHRQNSQPSDPGYDTIIRTRAQRSRERAESEIPQPRSSDAEPRPRRRSTNVPTLPVPRGPDGKFLP